MMKKKTIGFIGGGRITRVFLQAFKNLNTVFKDIVVFDPNPNVFTGLKRINPGILTENTDIGISAKCDILFLAVHPPLILDILTKISTHLKKDLILVSLAPKISIEKIRSALNGHNSVVKVNPSANGIVNQGYNPVAFSNTMSKEDKKTVLSLLQILGESPIVEESKLEAYALISAMGPTYFMFQFQQLKTLGMSFGMNEKEVMGTISVMLKGTVNVFFNSGLTPEEAMDLIPVKPLGEYEEIIKTFYSDKLTALYNKIKP